MSFLNNVQRASQGRTMTVATDASPFGCCNFFDKCGSGELFSLYYRGILGLLDWLGFKPTNICYRTVEFIDYVRPAQSDGSDTAGYISDPCADPNGIEFGSCKITVEDFGLLGRKGPDRKLFKPTRYCINSPKYFLDGSPVTSEIQWDMFFAMDVMLNDLRKLVITGNSTTGGQFDGLQRWVKTGYDCAALNSTVIDFNGNPMTGGAGVTVNGVAVAGGPYHLVEFLLDHNRQVNDRISWSPLLSQQAQRGMDKIILLPSFLGRCLLDSYACWSVCPGAQYEEIFKSQKEIREFRNSLNGGRFGHGKIYLDSEEISLLFYDWGLINSQTLGDMYFLVGQVGSQRIWEGEHLDANEVMRILAENGLEAASGFQTFDDGRVLARGDFSNLCATRKVWMAPRLFCMAPWMQARIQDVQCHSPLGPLSPDPADTSFFPDASFDPADCP